MELIVGFVICYVLYLFINTFVHQPIVEEEKLNEWGGDGPQWYELTDYQKKLWIRGPHGTPLYTDSSYPDLTKKEFYKHYGFRLSDMTEREVKKNFGQTKKELYKILDEVLDGGNGCIFL